MYKYPSLGPNKSEPDIRCSVRQSLPELTSRLYHIAILIFALLFLSCIDLGWKERSGTDIVDLEGLCEEEEPSFSGWVREERIVRGALEL